MQASPGKKSHTGQDYDYVRTDSKLLNKSGGKLKIIGQFVVEQNWSGG